MPIDKTTKRGVTVLQVALPIVMVVSIAILAVQLDRLFMSWLFEDPPFFSRSRSLRIFICMLLVAAYLAYCCWDRIRLFFRPRLTKKSFLIKTMFVLGIIVVLIDMYYQARHHLLPHGTFQNRMYIVELSLFLGFIIVVAPALIYESLSQFLAWMQVTHETAEEPAMRHAFFEPDAPIESLEDDLLNRKPFIDGLVARLRTYKAQRSLVLGICSDWGGGKTSVLNMLQTELRQHDNVLCIDYNPWNFPERESRIRNFFHAIATHINRRYPDMRVGRHIMRYARIITKAIGKGDFYDVLFGTNNQDLAAAKRDLCEAIRSIDTTIIICIDDLDRLQTKQEAMDILALIRAASDLPNCVYVLAFDRTHLTDDNGLGLQEDYLEKIVQVLVPLPVVDAQELKKLLYALLRRLEEDGVRLFGDAEERAAFYEEIEKHQACIFSSAFLDNLRDVKRLFNSFLFRISRLVGEINVYDVLALELLWLKFPTIYEDILTSPQYYKYPEWDRTLPFGFKEIDEIQKEADGHFSSLFEQATKREKADSVRKLLGSVFPLADKDASSGVPEEAEYESKKKVAHPRYFYKPFFQDVPPGQLSDREIDDFFSDIETKLESDLTKEFETYSGKGSLPEILEALLARIDEIDKKAYRPICAALCNFACSLSYMERFFPFDSEIHLAVKIILSFASKMLAQTEDATNFIREAIEKTTNDYMAILLMGLAASRAKAGKELQGIDVERLKERLQQRFEEKYTNQKADIFKEYPYVWIELLASWVHTGDAGAKRARQYLLNMLQSNPERIGTLLRQFIIALPVAGALSTALNRFDKLTPIIDINELKEIIANVGETNCAQNDEERQAIALFLRWMEGKQEEAGTSEPER